MAIAFKGHVTGSTTNGNNITLNLAAPTSGSAPSAGDIVFAVSCSFNRAGNEGRIGNALTYAETHNFTGVSRRHRAAWKAWTTGENSVVVEGTANASDGMAAVAVWFSGANAGSPFSATSTTASGSSTNPNPAAIVPADNNCAIVVLAGSGANDAAPGTIASYTVLSGIAGNDTNPNSAAVAYRILSGGSGVSEDPAAFNAWITGGWYVVTAALKEASAGDTVTVDSASLTLSASAVAEIEAIAVAAAELAFAGSTIATPGDAELIAVDSAALVFASSSIAETENIGVTVASLALAGQTVGVLDTETVTAAALALAGQYIEITDAYSGVLIDAAELVLVGQDIGIIDSGEPSVVAAGGGRGWWRRRRRRESENIEIILADLLLPEAVPEVVADLPPTTITAPAHARKSVDGKVRRRLLATTYIRDELPLPRADLLRLDPGLLRLLDSLPPTPSWGLPRISSPSIRPGPDEDEEEVALLLAILFD